MQNNTSVVETMQWNEKKAALPNRLAVHSYERFTSNIAGTVEFLMFRTGPIGNTTVSFSRCISKEA